MTATFTYTEAELVSRLKQKDQQAFSYLYDNYAASLNGVAYKMLQKQELAEDILQEAFVKIWNNITMYDESKGRLFTWMLNITRNLAIDLLRSKGYRKQQQIRTDEFAVSNVAADNNIAERFDTMGLRKQLENLKPEQKQVLDLAYFSGYTQDEISKETGIPLGTVKTRMRTAISELRKMFNIQLS